jgi:plastocyanin
MLRIVSAVAATVVLSITGIFTSPALATTTPPPAPQQWDVTAGSPEVLDSFGPRGAGNRFYPESIAIHAGDSIAFKPHGPHTVTFNRAPGPVFLLLFDPNAVTPSPATLASTTGAVNGVLGFGPPPQPPFVLTFTSPGSYKIICMLHFGMSEMVNVLATDVTLPKTKADYAAIAQAEIDRDTASVNRIDRAATDNFQDEDGNPTVLVGAGNSRVSNIRFYPSSVTIKVGKTITFLKTQDPTEPHTVLFGGSELDMFTELIPIDRSAYDGSGTANSGFMVTRDQFDYYQLGGFIPGLTGALTKYTLTFTKAGDFKYICGIHDGAGMFGFVHVR